MLKIAVKTGVIGGLILIVPTIIQMIIGMDKFWFTAVISLLLLALVIWLVVRAVKDYRSESENRISFGSAFNISLTSFLIIAVLSIIFSYIHQNYIDPEYGQKAKALAIQKFEEKTSNNPNISEDQKAIYMDKFENADYSLTPIKALKSLGLSIGFYLFISLIIAASVKKDLNEIPL